MPKSAKRRGFDSDIHNFPAYKSHLARVIRGVRYQAYNSLNLGGSAKQCPVMLQKFLLEKPKLD
jgi:hypothetical protein